VIDGQAGSDHLRVPVRRGPRAVVAPSGAPDGRCQAVTDGGPMRVRLEWALIVAGLVLLAVALVGLYWPE